MAHDSASPSGELLNNEVIKSFGNAVFEVCYDLNPDCYKEERSLCLFKNLR